MSSSRESLANRLPEVARRVFEVCEPWLVASRHGAAAEAPRVDIGPLLRFDPLRVSSEDFISRVERLQQRTSSGLTIPRWALFDCGEVPGAVFGFADVVDDEPIPVSMIVAIPMLKPGAWHVYALGAIDSVSGLQTRVLHAATLATAVTVLGATRLSAVVPWCCDELHAFARFAPLELATAWTPAHSIVESFTCRFEVPLPGVSDEPDRWIDVADVEAQRAIQAEIEAGASYRITGSPRVENGRTTVPVSGTVP